MITQVDEKPVPAEVSLLGEMSPLERMMRLRSEMMFGWILARKERLNTPDWGVVFSDHREPKPPFRESESQPK